MSPSQGSNSQTSGSSRVSCTPLQACLCQVPPLPAAMCESLCLAVRHLVVPGGRKKVACKGCGLLAAGGLLLGSHETAAEHSGCLCPSSDLQPAHRLLT